MTTIQIVKKMVIAGLLAALTACGGGGGGGSNFHATTPTDPNQEFSLAKVKSTTPGTVYTTELTGTDSAGGQWTGSLSITNREQLMYEGLLVTPQDSLVTLSYQGTSDTSGSTTYIDSSGYELGTREQDGTICTPAFLSQLPDVVKIGNADTGPIATCSDDTTVDTNWRVEDASNGNAYFITAEVIRDQFGETVGSGETTLTLNAKGDILAFKIVISGLDIPTVTLHNK